MQDSGDDQGLGLEPGGDETGRVVLPVQQDQLGNLPVADMDRIDDDALVGNDLDIRLCASSDNSLLPGQFEVSSNTHF